MSSEPPISPDLIQRALRGELPDDQLEQVVAYWQAQPGNTPPDDSLADPLLDAVRDTLTIRGELTRVEVDVAPLVERLVRTDLASPLAESPSDGAMSPQPASSEVTYAGPADSATIDASNAESGDGGARRPVAPLSSAGVTMGTPDPLVTVGPSHDSGSLTASQSTRRDAGLATPVESELVPGLVIGAYKIIRKIGQGGMGMVFLAEHQRMERLVALKVLPPSVTKHLNAVERFHREVKAMARLSHPNIVTAFDADEARGLHILVMEYVDGQDLAALVKKRGPLSVEHAVDYIVQGAKGLEYAHKRGLVHRDIKPSNFLVDTEGQVKILDLGLARFSEQDDDGEGPPGMDLTGTGVVVGTVDYMSPEQAEDTKRADARADIYSLGCSLFYLISGRSMFSGDTVVARLMAHQNQPVPSLRSINPAVPEELDRIHRKMVAKKKDDRYQTATALLDDLRKLAPEAFAGQGPRFAPDAARPVNDEQTFVGPLSGSVTSGSTAFAEVTPASLSKALGAGMRPPGNKKLLVGAAAAALVLLMGWVIVFRDKDGKEVGRVEVPGAGPAVVQTANSGTATITRTGDASQPDQEAVNSATGSSRDGWQSWPADAPKPAIAPFDPAQAKQHQEEWAAYLKVPVEYTNSIGMNLRLIPPGEFTMGSPAGEERRRDDETQVSVTLARAFQLSRTEVTQGQWRAVMGTEPWKGQFDVQEGDDYAATYVSWEEAVSFCEKLSAKERKGYRLPTEAEWEWTCRSGSRTAYSFGGSEGDLGRYAWFRGNTHDIGEKYAHRVGQKLPNGFGLSDMHGNVWEWCGDWHGEKLVGGSNPVGASSGSHRSHRGGSWYDTAGPCRSAYRSWFDPSFRHGNLGFRLALSPSDAAKAASGEGIPLAKSLNTSKTGWHGWPADAPKPAIAPFDAAQAKTHQEEWAAYLKVPVEYTSSIGMKFRLIPPGEFTMGSTAEEIVAALKDVGEDKLWQECIQSEAPQHKVILTQPIYLGVNEVNQAEYEKVMGVNPSHFALTGMGKEAVAGLETAKHPVEMVSWNDAAEFCAKLSQQEKLKPFYFRAGETITPLDGTGYRLPSEAEWEYACRAGTATKYWIGDKDEDLVRAGWFGGNSGGRTHAAAELQSNPFGLHDIHGNVWEWVQDGWDATWYGQFSEKPAVNPSSPFPAGSQRVLRGGYWNITASRCRSPFRDASAPAGRYRGIGFRVSLSVAAVKAANNNPNGAERALAFDGVDDHMEIPRLMLRKEKPITVEAWLTPQTWKHSAIINISGKRPVSLYLDEGTVGFWCLGSKIEMPAPATLVGQRIHVAGVYDEKNLTVYLNGQPSAKIKPLVSEGGEPLMAIVGAIRDWENNFLTLRGFFHGQLHAIRVSETVRYTAEFNPPTELGSDAETLVCYQFQARHGDTVRDLSSHHFDGRVIGARWVADNRRSITGWPADAPKPAIAPFDAAQARQHQEAWAKYLQIDVEYTNALGMKFVLIPPGEFAMGSTAEEIAAALKDAGEDKYWQERIKSEAPQHKVILTQPIYLGVNEVTQAEYEKVMGVNPSHFAPMGMDKEAVAGLETAGHPVEMVSWNDAAEFCAKLSQQEKLKPFYFRAGETITPLDGTGYRLPSEAEWEYACRAGTATKYWIGDKDEDLVRAGWFGRKSGGRTHAAGELQANPFGLYDIHGNVWEWVQDGWDATWYGQFSEKPAVNPSSPFSAGSQRVIRGGYWNITASRCRSPFRDASAPAGRYRGIGFRVSLSVAAVKAALAERAAPLIPDAPVVAPDATNRAGAEWILARGGEVTVIGVNGWITRPDDLPKDPFVVRLAKFSKQLPQGDSDLVPLRGMSGLTFVGLDGSMATPAGIAGLIALPNLRRLSCGAMKLTDEHIDALGRLPRLEGLFMSSSDLTVSRLARLANGLPRLTSLNVTANAALDDGAVPHLSRFFGLNSLQLGGTSVTARGVEELRRRLPKCQIDWTGTDTSWHGWPADAPKPAIAPFDAAQAKQHQEVWAAYLKVPVEYTNSLGLKFRLIPPGEFQMGSTSD
jgi:formylglycine-generating enzyme required for sulfatase activity/serine/threonine protein kinase